MPDLSKLEALIARLAGIDFSQSREIATREMAVIPLIDALGWDTFNLDEVAREFSVRSGRPDYCLRTQARNLVMIEVKRTGTEFSKDHEDQLLRYAFDEGVPLAVLTDGLVWWLYLPTAEGTWERRRFFRINFREQPSADAAAALYRFLNRDGLVSGKAQEEARREFESQERDRRVRAALPRAWQRVLGDPDSLLREELADTVTEISGYRPEEKVVADFLQEMLGSEGGMIVPMAMQTVSAKKTRTPDRRLAGIGHGETQSSDSGRPVETSTRNPAENRTGKNRSIKPTAIWLDGIRYEVTAWGQIVPELCALLAREIGSDFNKRVSGLRGTKRRYFSTSPDELHTAFPIPGFPLYVEGNLSSGLAERIARRTLHAVRGTDDGFRIERAELPPDS